MIEQDDTVSDMKSQLPLGVAVRRQIRKYANTLVRRLKMNFEIEDVFGVPGKPHQYHKAVKYGELYTTVNYILDGAQSTLLYEAEPSSTLDPATQTNRLLGLIGSNIPSLVVPVDICTQQMKLLISF